MTTQEAIDIGKADEVLKKAQDLIYQAYDLISTDPVAKRYLDIQCKIGWLPHVWNKLLDEYDLANPDNTDTWHLRAFDFYKLTYGTCISTSGMVESSGG